MLAAHWPFVVSINEMKYLEVKRLNVKISGPQRVKALLLSAATRYAWLLL